MFEQLKEMNTEMENLKKQHLEKCKVMFHEIAKKLFEKHDSLNSFEWTQYTPYFNDGDECTFSAHVDEPYVNGLDPYDDNSSDEKWSSETKGYIPNPDYNPIQAASRKDVVEFLQNINESVLRDMFGDHKRVTVDRAGTSVEDYEHD